MSVSGHARKFVKPALVTLLAAVVLFMVVKWVPLWLADTEGLSGKDRAEELGRARTALLAVLAGAIAVFGSFTAHRSYLLSRDVAETTAQLTREGQLTEQFTRAVDQLGTTNLDVRLGGIYALERIAQLSEREHGPVMEILTAWIREHSNDDWPRLKEISDEAQVEVEDVSRGVPVDLQAALTVVARRRVAHDGRLVIDLSGAQLRGADLVGAQLAGARMRHTRLSGASLDDADLSGADLTSTDLRNAVMDGADLSRAQARSSHLDEAWLTRAKLVDTRLSGGSLRKAMLDESDLTGALLLGVNLRGASLRGVNLEGTLARGAVFDRSTTVDEAVDLAELGARSETQEL